MSVISGFWEGPHDVVKAFTGIEPGSPIVAFTHNPDIFLRLPMSVGLAIAGHTHAARSIYYSHRSLALQRAFRGTRYC